MAVLRAKWDSKKFIDKLIKRSKELQPVIDKEIYRFLRIKFNRARAAWPVDSGYSRDSMTIMKNRIANSADDVHHVFWMGNVRDTAWRVLVARPVFAELGALKKRIRRMIVRYLKANPNPAP